MIAKIEQLLPVKIAVVTCTSPWRGVRKTPNANGAKCAVRDGDNFSVPPTVSLISFVSSLSKNF